MRRALFDTLLAFLCSLPFLGAFLPMCATRGPSGSIQPPIGGPPTLSLGPGCPTGAPFEILPVKERNVLPGQGYLIWKLGKLTPRTTRDCAVRVRNMLETPIDKGFIFFRRTGPAIGIYCGDSAVYSESKCKRISVWKKRLRATRTNETEIVRFFIGFNEEDIRLLKTDNLQIAVSIAYKTKAKVSGTIEYYPIVEVNKETGERTVKGIGSLVDIKLSEPAGLEVKEVSSAMFLEEAHPVTINGKDYYGAVLELDIVPKKTRGGDYFWPEEWYSKDEIDESDVEMFEKRLAAGGLTRRGEIREVVKRTTIEIKSPENGKVYIYVEEPLTEGTKVSIEGEKVEDTDVVKEFTRMVSAYTTVDLKERSFDLYKCDPSCKIIVEDWTFSRLTTGGEAMKILLVLFRGENWLDVSAGERVVIPVDYEMDFGIYSRNLCMIYGTTAEI